MRSIERPSLHVAPAHDSAAASLAGGIGGGIAGLLTLIAKFKWEHYFSSQPWHGSIF